MPPNAVYYYQHGYYTGSYSLSKAEDVTDATRVEEGAANLSKGNDDVEAVREGGLVREKKAISSSEDSNSSSESQNVEASSHTSGFIKQVSSKKKARPPPIFIPPSSAPLRPSITSPLKKPMSASIVTHPRGTGYFYPSPIFSEIPTPTSATSSSSYKASSLPSSSVRGQFVPIAPKPPQAYYPHISFSNYPFFNGTLKDHPHSATIPTTTFSAAMSAHTQSSKYSPILPRPSTITTKSASNSPLNSPLMKSPIVLPDPQITKSPGSPNSVAASDKESVGSDHATNPLDMLAEAASTIVRKKGESRKRASIEKPLESGTNNDNEEGMEGGKKKRAKTTRSRKGKDPEQ
ncbi:hypothetical protein BKA69DRAFT_1040115 [Paraphysoderma sedebokerense]|nr:hypothetical protein BKA69DRAFT_1040115 [Paraphysoderma sedebokerense]